MDPLKLDHRSTALVVIDLQQGIVGRPVVPYSGPVVVQRSSQLANALRAKGGLVVYVRVAMHELRTATVDAPGRDPNAPAPPPEASELITELPVQEGDLIVTKRQWGAFYGTDLDQQLRRRGIKTLILTGIATNFGVESTARAAMDIGYDLIFAEDAMSSVSMAAHEFSAQSIFPRMGRVRSTAEILQAL